MSGCCGILGYRLGEWGPHEAVGEGEWVVTEVSTSGQSHVSATSRGQATRLKHWHNNWSTSPAQMGELEWSRSSRSMHNSSGERRAMISHKNHCRSRWLYNSTKQKLHLGSSQFWTQNDLSNFKNDEPIFRLTFSIPSARSSVISLFPLKNS